MDINMIQEKLVDYNYDTEQTINYLIGQASLADDDNNQSKNRPKKSINAHKNRKMEKKARQMERQKLNYQLKANEQHDDKIQSKRTSSLNNGQQNQQHMFEQAENLSISTISNTQTKLI